MSNKENIEKHMSDLARRDSQAPPAFVWKEIEHHLDDQYKRKLAWWWFFIPMLMLAIPLYLVFFTSSDHRPQDTTGKLLSPTPESKENIAEQNSHDKELVFELDNKEISSLNKNNPTQDLKQKALADAKSTMIHNNNDVLDAKLISTIEDPVKESIQKTAKTVNSRNTEKARVTISATNTINEINKLKTNKVNSNSMLEGQPTEEFAKVETSFVLDKTTNHINSSRASLSCSMLPFLEIGDIDYDRAIQSLDRSLQPIAIDKNAESEDSSPWFLDAHAFAGLQFVSFDLDGAGLSSLRETAEKTWYSWGGELQLGYYLADRFYVSAGLSYRQLKSKFDYQYRSGTDIVHSDSLLLLESVITTDTLFFSKGETNHHLFDVTTVMGYQYDYDKFSVGAEIGLGINLYASEQGKVYLGGMEIARLEELSYAKSRVSLSLLFNATASYKINENFSLMVKPGLRYQFSDTYTSSSPYGKQFTMIGSSAGLRYKF